MWEVGRLSRRLVVRVAIVLATVFGFSFFTVVAAHAQAPPPCAFVDLGITKDVSPDFNVAVNDIITHTLTITATSDTPPVGAAQPCGPLNVRVQDFASPNQEFQAPPAGPGGLTCSGTNIVTCTYTIDVVPAPGTRTDEIVLRFRAEDPGVTGQYCDNATVEPTNAGDSNPSNNNTGEPTCASAEGPPPSPGNGDDDGAGGLNGFTQFDGGFDTFGTTGDVSTPLGGVDTGAGGTAGSNAAVPQIALASLLMVGLLLFRLRRLRRA